MTEDTRLKLAAGIYGDFVTNADVNNANNRKHGYKPAVQGTHEQWVKSLLSGVQNPIQNALSDVEITNATEQQSVMTALAAIDRDVALAVYLKLKHDYAHFKGAAGGASSHDY